MKQQEQDAIALEMAINRAVDVQLDAIVQVAVRLAARLKDSRMRENQLRNVLDTALHTESLELVANFIRYQIGRGRDWQHNDFGEALIATFAQGGVIHQVTKRIEALVQREIQEGGLALPAGAINDETRRAIRMKLARRLLAEMNRAFLFADRTGGWDKLQPVLAAIDLTADPAVQQNSAEA